MCVLVCACQATIEDEVQLSVKIGIGVGMVSVIHIGGTYKRMEYIAVGDPLVQAFHAEHHAVPGQVMVSPQAWRLLIQLHAFQADKKFEDGFVSISVKAPFAPVRQRRLKPFLKDGDDDGEGGGQRYALLEQRIKGYVPNSVLPMLLRGSYEDDMKWANETRRCAVMFVNLGLEEHNLLAAGDVRQRDAMVQVHNVLVGVQKAVYHYEGSVNKFLMDDKGSTLIACFGLSPVSHGDDAARAVLSALYICERLFDLSFPASVGITVGDVFCGVVGSTTRREYTVLGDSVNLAARLMQQACGMAESGRPTGGVIVDDVCRAECDGLLEFQRLEPISVKGKTGKIKIFHPFPEEFWTQQLKAPMHSMNARPRNLFREMHMQQLRNLEVHKLMLLQLTMEAKTMKYRANAHLLRHDNKTYSHGAASFSILGEDDVRGFAGKQLSKRPTALPGRGPPPPPKSFLGSAVSLAKSVASIAKAPAAPAPAHRQSSKMILNRASAMSKRNSVTGVGLGAVVSHVQNQNLLHRSPDRSATQPGDFVPPTAVTVAVAAWASLVVELGDAPGAKGPELDPLELEGIADFMALLEAVHAAAEREGLLEGPAHAAGRHSTVDSKAIAEGDERDSGFTGFQQHGPEHFLLHIVGTRYFLPRSAVSVRWLRAFVCRAHGLPAHNDEVPLAFSGDGVAAKLQLVHESAALNLQSRACVARFVLLEKHALLVDKGMGNVVLVEGDPGCGKTDVLASTLDNATLQPTEDVVPPPFLVATASAFHSRPYGCWCGAVQQLLDLLSARDATAKAEAETLMSDKATKPRPEDAEKTLVMETLVRERFAAYSDAISESHDLTMHAFRGLVRELLSDPEVTDPEDHIEPPSDKDLDAAFELADEDKGGTVDEDEFMKLWSLVLHGDVRGLGKSSRDMLRRKAESAAETVRQMRTTKCLSLLPPALRDSAYLLNELVGVDCESVTMGSRRRANDTRSYGHHQQHTLEGSHGRLTLRLLYYLLKALTEACPAALIVDDAQAMDPESWALAHAVVNGIVTADDDEDGDGDDKEPAGCLQLMLVLALRPMAEYGSAFRRMPPDFDALVGQASSSVHVSRVKIDGLCPEEVAALAVNELGPQVKFAGERLLTTLEELCMGNPMAIIEFVAAVRTAEPPVLTFSKLTESDADAAGGESARAGQSAAEASLAMFASHHYYADLAEGVTVIDQRITKQRNRMAKFYTEKLDKCSPKLKLLLKAASSVTAFLHRRFEETQRDKQSGDSDPSAFLNATFKLSYVEACHPVEAHKRTLEDDVDQLVRRGILVEVPQDTLTKGPAAAITKDNAADRTLRFAHGILLAKHLQRMMLKGQQAELINRVAKYQAELDEKQRMAFMGKALKALGSLSELKKGFLRIRKVEESENRGFLQQIKRNVEGGDWKVRWCVLKGSKVYMYRRQSDDNHTQMIELMGGVTELEPFEVYDRHTFRVEARKHVKDGKTIDEERPFIFASALEESADGPESLKRDVDDWHYMFKFAVESGSLQKKTETAEVGGGAAKKTSKSLKAIRQKHLQKIRKKTGHSSHGGLSGSSHGGGRAGTRFMSEMGTLDEGSLEGLTETHSLAETIALGWGAMVEDDAEMAIEEDDNAVDSRLLLRLSHCKELVNTAVHGVCNPYVRVVLDERVIETRTYGDTTTSPEFLKDFALPVDIGQWGRSALRIEVWNREPFLTDDFLGQLVIPLVSVTPQPWDEDAVIRPEQIAAHKLTARHSEGEKVNGELFIGLSLIMSPRTTERAEQLGGVAALRNQVSSKAVTRAAMDAALKSKAQAARRAVEQRRAAEEASRPKPVEADASELRLRRLVSDGKEGGDGVVDRSALAGTALGAVDAVWRQLGAALTAVETQALPTLPAVGTKGVDRKWVHGELKTAARAIITIIDAHAPRVESGAAQSSSVGAAALVALAAGRAKGGGDDGGSVLSSTVDDLVQRTGLDAEQQQWLESQYSRNQSEAVSASSSAKSPITATTRSRDMFMAGRDRKASTGTPLLFKGAASKVLSADDPLFWYVRPLEESEDMEDTAEVSGEGKDVLWESRAPLGPFSAHQLLAAYRAGYLRHPRTRVLQAARPGLPPPEMPVGGGLDGGPDGGWVPAESKFAAVRTAVASGDDGSLWASSALPTINWRAWDFDVWSVEPACLDRVVLEMLYDLNLVEEFDVDPCCLRRFLHRVNAAMSLHGNAYHNAHHSFDVAQSCFVLATKMQCSDLLGPLELFALIIGALCHDLEHPGYNNAFAVNAMTFYAVRYNDQSVLENHHIAVAWTILRAPGCEVLDSLLPEQLKQVRKMMIASILATDMTFHFSLKGELDGVILRNARPAEAAEAESPVDKRRSLESDLDRTVLLKVVLHMADISNPCKPWAVGKLWSDRVIEEFFRQGDQEKALSLPPTPNMDRETTKQAELSVNFIDFIVGPFFMALTNLLPKVRECCELMQSNRNEWSRMVCEDLSARCDLDEAKRVEAVAKWKSREMSFNDLIGPIIANARVAESGRRGSVTMLKGT